MAVKVQKMRLIIDLDVTYEDWLRDWKNILTRHCFGAIMDSTDGGWIAYPGVAGMVSQNSAELMVTPENGVARPPTYIHGKTGFEKKD